MTGSRGVIRVRFSESDMFTHGDGVFSINENLWDVTYWGRVLQTSRIAW